LAFGCHHGAVAAGRQIWAADLTRWIARFMLRDIAEETDVRYRQDTARAQAVHHIWTVIHDDFDQLL
jgi:hypothetical protein